MLDYTSNVYPMGSYGYIDLNVNPLVWSSYGSPVIHDFFGGVHQVESNGVMDYRDSVDDSYGKIRSPYTDYDNGAYGVYPAGNVYGSYNDYVWDVSYGRLSPRYDIETAAYQIAPPDEEDYPYTMAVDWSSYGNYIALRSSTTTTVRIMLVRMVTSVGLSRIPTGIY